MPESVPFPVTVVSIMMVVGQKIKKHSTILRYKYWEYRDDPEQLKQKEDNPQLFKDKDVDKIRMEFGGSYEIPMDAEVEEINIKIGDEVVHSDQVIAKVLEPCTHPIQYSGLCAVCGKDLEEVDYSGYNYQERNSIAVSYGSSDIKMSMNEAERIEQSSMKHLLKDKKLILVVDLDQTVIHATVDPTVAEWQKDPSNPNYSAVKDVQKFSLEETPILPPGYTGPQPRPTVCWYYVKVRPGLEEFLSKISEIYEMHIYTMATRAYAKAIAKIIDPDGRYFGDRILSRDESGSLTQKSLKRLFPVDQSMVVVIDDRGDVWNWSPNLIKVVPYDFFVGIGDINSSFLPRQHALLGPSKRRKSLADLEEKLNAEKDLEEFGGRPPVENEDNEEAVDLSDSESEASEANSTLASSPIERILEIGGGEDNTDLLAAQSSKRNASLEQQQHDRPLAKLQDDLDKIIEKESRNGTPKHEENDTNGSLLPLDTDLEKRNLLYDEDTELHSLGQALVRVHNEFYYEFENQSTGPPDVKDIMTQMKQFVFTDLTFLFSGILPIGSRLDSADIVIWSRSFGAKVVPNYTQGVTHVICKSLGTYKVRLAKTIDPNCKIVHPDWIFKCMALWEQVPEDDYIIELHERDLLSKEEADQYMKSHDIGGLSLEDSNNVNESSMFIGAIDWDDLDMPEFSDSDQEDDDSKKRVLSDDEDANTSKRMKLDESEIHLQDGEEDEDDDDDDLLNEIMQGLEEDEEDGESQEN